MFDSIIRVLNKSTIEPHFPDLSKLYTASNDFCSSTYSFLELVSSVYTLLHISELHNPVQIDVL